MEQNNNLKALFIVINAGYTDEVMGIARKAGIPGATILNARGEGATHKVFMGITMDSEKEIILSVVNENVAEAVMQAVKEKAGVDRPAHSVCFTLPVEQILGLNVTSMPIAEE